MVIALLVDANGNILGMGHLLSRVLTTVVFAAAVGIAVFVTLANKRWWRIIAIVSLLTYAVLLMPLLLP